MKTIPRRTFLRGLGVTLVLPYFETHATLDQIMAREIGTGTLHPSLELSYNDFTDNKETRYYECISCLAPGYAANVEKNPRAIFQRLFGRPDAARSQSVIDVVLEDAKTLRGVLGKADQGKLDEYLESVRATERRLEFAEKIAAQMERPSMAEPFGIPERRGDYRRLQAELFILAFQYDLTRVATLVVHPERWDSPRTFHDVFDKPQNHYVLTYRKDIGAKDDVAKIDRFHVEFYAHIIERLKSIREGEGTLLDATIVSMGSGISDGDRHDYANLEVLLAGGRMKPGHIYYQDDHPLANLWLTLAQNAGVSTERFVDSTGAIRDLIV